MAQPTSAERSRRYRARTSRFVEAVRRTAGCIDCGTVEGRLDFDHRDPNTKSFTVASGARSIATVVVEIEKCDVRCARCHQLRHIAADPDKVVRAGRKGGRAFRRTTYCKYGHSLADAHVSKRGYLECKTCKRLAKRRYDQRRKAARGSES